MKNKIIKSLTVLILLNFIVYSAFGAAYYSNKKSAAADTNLYVSEKTTGDIISVKCTGTDSEFELVKDSDFWKLSGDDSFPISSDSVERLIEKSGNLAAARLISSDGEYSKYGLDTPQQVITLTDTAGVSTTYRIGNFNDNINRYYACEDGSKKIYIINKSVGDEIIKPLYSYAAAYDLSGLSRATLEEFECVYGDEKTAVFKSETDRENPMGSSSPWRFAFPFSSSTFADTNKVDSLISKLKDAALSQCVSFEPSKNDTAAFGLETPQAYISVKYKTDSGEKSAKMYLGKENADGSAYISFEGSSITGLLDSDTAKVIKEYLSCYKYIPQSVCTVKKDKVASMEVTLNSVVHHIEFKENGYTLDGRDCDSESFEAFFKKLSGIVSSSVSDTAAATGPDSESFIVTYHFKDSSYPDAQAVYTPFDENYYTASSGEIKGRLVNRRSVESVISLFETVKQSN